MSDMPFGKLVRVFTGEGVMDGKLSGFSHQHLLVKVGDRIQMVPYEVILAADLFGSQTPASGRSPRADALDPPSASRSNGRCLTDGLPLRSIDRMFSTFL